MNRSINTNAASKRYDSAAMIAALLAGALGSDMLPLNSLKQDKEPVNPLQEPFDSLRSLMSDVLKRMIALDAHLSPEAVQLRYDPKGEGFDHPYAAREEWREAVTDEDTDLGYWAWIVMKLNDHAEAFAEEEEEKARQLRNAEAREHGAELAERMAQSAPCAGCETCSKG